MTNMTSTTNQTTNFELPQIPVPHKLFVPYVAEHEFTSIKELVEPYNIFESKLREGFAVHPDHPVVQDLNVNLVPVFGSHNLLRTQARKLDDDVVNQQYIMPLKPEDRKPSGAPVVVDSLKDFKKNFNLFSESSLIDLDWANVVAAGSSVVTPLTPVPEKYNTSKKALREYYHQKLAPSSDVDLFIWGLDEAAAIEKIKQIETSVRNAILEEVTTLRTKNAITIVSRYPTRHVQIVLRLYKSISEVLTGFDVDCSCFAYDGSQVYATPRALAAFITQTNTIDLTRRSPSYESRLSKYARRGFEIHWPDFDRSRIDPTVFERSFARTSGLARLLVLERLPKPNDREAYIAQRREERGRPERNTDYQYSFHRTTNLKENNPEDIAEWVYDDVVSSYHTFTIPYGPKYHAKKIEKMLYTKDLLLNAEWNAKKDRKVSLHRHPCFIGDTDSIIHDCCGLCPEPKTNEERIIAEEEGKIYVAGELSFMKDDPGRQAIGSFNPLTADDWTDMAYIGGTSELCHKICECDLAYVEDWCSKEDSQINRRDHTGRTPLHLATQCSSPEVVHCLINNGARIVARLIDGTTALHIAALRGNFEMVKTLLEKSEANEEKEAEKEEARTAMLTTKYNDDRHMSEASEEQHVSEGEDEVEDEGMEDVASEQSAESTTLTEGSFVKISDKSASEGVTLPEDEEDDEPDVYDVNVVAWDAPVSPLHLAILGGHIAVIKTLISTFGADVLLPVKLVDSYSRNPRAAILTLVLAAQVPGSKSFDVSKTLLSLGASSAQADMNRISALHYVIAKRQISVLKACFNTDEPAAKGALNHLVVRLPYYRETADTPLTTAIRSGDVDLVNMVLDLGSKPSIELDDFVSAYSFAVEGSQNLWHDNDSDVTQKFKEITLQPVLLAVEHDMPNIVFKLLSKGISVNTLDHFAYQAISSHELNRHNYRRIEGKSLLDYVDQKIEDLQKSAEDDHRFPKPPGLGETERYLDGLAPGSYEHWHTSKELYVARAMINEWYQRRADVIKNHESREGRKEMSQALNHLKSEFEALREHLVNAGALKMEQLHPDVQASADKSAHRPKDADSERPGDVNPGDENYKLFKPEIAFRLPNITDKTREGYLQLYRAAWEGNAEKIQELTLTPWGTEKENAPLQIAIADTNGFSPFAIAALRQHTNVAKLILTIADAQHERTENVQLRQYTMLGDYSDEYSDDDEDELGISSNLIDEKFTVDDITALPKSVASKVSVCEMLCWDAAVWMFFDKPESIADNGLKNFIPSPVLNSNDTAENIFKSSMKHRQGKASLVRYALIKHDVSLLRFLLHCGRESSIATTEQAKKSFAESISVEFQFALTHGNIEALAEMVKIAGAELPIEALVKQSGVKESERPKYYPGLSIGGKKMTKWAQEGGGRWSSNISNDAMAPLLQTAYHGGLAATEWFLSDTPFRLYKEFGTNNSEDSRLKVLAKAHGGFDQAVASWLRRRNNLSLHGAVLSHAGTEKSLEVVKYLVESMPESLETKSMSGHTPLSLAFNERKVQIARHLITAGADQTTRDRLGRNILHLVLCNVHSSAAEFAPEIRSLLGLVDKRVVKSLFVERCHGRPGGTTPLARWLWQPNSNRWGTSWQYTHQENRSLEVLDAILDYSEGEDLVMMDGSGQFPLHQAVRTRAPNIVARMLAHDPALLWQENAMGQTPLELAESLYIRHCTNENPDIRPASKKKQELEPKDFLPKNDDGIDAEVDNVVRTWRICQASAVAHPGMRKLISVSEAREVAKRLTEQTKSEPTTKSTEEEEEEDGEEEKEEFRDEVSRWLGI